MIRLSTDETVTGRFEDLPALNAKNLWRSRRELGPASPEHRRAEGNEDMSQRRGVLNGESFSSR